MQRKKRNKIVQSKKKHKKLVNENGINKWINLFACWISAAQFRCVKIKRRTKPQIKRKIRFLKWSFKCEMSRRKKWFFNSFSLPCSRTDKISIQFAIYFLFSIHTHSTKKKENWSFFTFDWMRKRKMPFCVSLEVAIDDEDWWLPEVSGSILCTHERSKTQKSSTEKKLLIRLPLNLNLSKIDCINDWTVQPFVYLRARWASSIENP